MRKIPHALEIILAAILTASALIVLFHPSRSPARGVISPCSLTIMDLIKTGEPLCRPIITSQ